MNWEALGATADMIGSLGVIVTLGYLAVQIRQNTRSVRGAAYQSIIESIASANDMLANNPQLSGVFRAGQEGTSELTEDETRTFHHLMNSFVRRFENVHLQDSRGLLEREDWSGFLESGLNLLSKKGAGAWWRQNAWRYNTPFVDFINVGLTARRVENRTD